MENYQPGHLVEIFDTVPAWKVIQRAERSPLQPPCLSARYTATRWRNRTHASVRLRSWRFPITSVVSLTPEYPDR